MKLKYQIFISSTYKDLIEERKKVIDTILSMYHFPIGMEMFNAANEEQWEIIRETIDSSDYYVLIIGGRYGSIIEHGDDAGISYTEKEFLYAVKKGIPVLAFIKKENSITVDASDTDQEKRDKLKAFKEKVTSQRQVQWFASSSELSSQVSVALYKEMERTKRPGWIRGGDTAEIDTLKSKIAELERENQELASNIRKPVLDINMKCESVGYDEHRISCEELLESLNMSNTADIYVPYRQISESGFLVPAEPLTLSDVPEDLKGEISQSVIDKYNQSLPDTKIIEQFNKKLFFYRQMVENGISLGLDVCNDGTLTATDIRITIDFPEDLFVMKRKDITKETAPLPPAMPANPFDEAYQRKIKNALPIFALNENHSKNFMSQCNAIFNPLQNPMSTKIGYTADLLADLSYNTERYIDIENSHTVKVRIKNLMHTYYCPFDDIYIVPLKTGRHTITVTFMCEEYPDPIELSKIIEVIDVPH